jgi:hypothetical protein
MIPYIQNLENNHKSKLLTKHSNKQIITRALDVNFPSFPRKCPFMFCRPQKCAAEGQQSSENQQQQQENQPSFQYNMVQRDDRKLQEVSIPYQ